MGSELKVFFTGGVVDGVLKISDRKAFDRDIIAFNGKRVQGYVTRLKKTRSNQQNKAIWGLAYPYATQGFIEAGNLGWTNDDTHEFFKQEFKPSFKDVIIPNSGELKTIITTTTASTNDMKIYYQQIQLFCAENFAIDIPDPDPLWNLNAE